VCHCVYLHFSLTDYEKSRLEWKMESQTGKHGERDSRTRLKTGKLPTPFALGRVKRPREQPRAYNLDYSECRRRRRRRRASTERTRIRAWDLSLLSARAE